MKELLKHLSPERCNELEKIVEFIKENIKDVQIVILFGKYAKKDFEEEYIEELDKEYDFLFVFKNERIAKNKTLDKKIEKKIIKNLELEISISIAYHGIDYLNQQIEECSHLFFHIYKEGIVLYNNGKFKLSTPKLVGKKRRYEKAVEYFNNWFEISEMFFKTYKMHILMAKTEENIKYFNLAVFDLHQASERYFMTISFVLSDYQPKIHNLEDLYKIAYKLDYRFKRVFNFKEKEERRIFKILNNAYIDSRYKMDYVIDPKDLISLEKRIEFLKKLTKKICSEKIKELKKELKNQEKE